MELIEAGRNRLNGQRQLAPARTKDLYMFMHCTGGCIMVTEDSFFEQHLSVFKAHGVKCTLPTEFVLSMRQGAEGE